MIIMHQFRRVTKNGKILKKNALYLSLLDNYSKKRYKVPAIKKYLTQKKKQFFKRNKVNI